MKPSDFLNQLPSVNELLDHPQVRSVADRLNRSVAATRVRGYLDQLADEVRGRAADAETVVSGSLPESMRDLASRVSRYLTRGDRWRIGVAINATGRFRGGPWVSTPLADAAVERIVLSASDFTFDAASAAAGDQTSQSVDAANALVKATGAPAAAVFTSRTAALCMALESLPRGGEVVIARRDLITVDGCRVADLIERAGFVPREVGATDGVTLDDYATATGAETAAILRVAGDDAPLPAAPSSPTGELAALAHRHGATLIEDMASAALLNVVGDAPHLATAVDGLASESMASTRSAGADIVIGRGDGLIGGPACGVVLGTSEAIQRLSSTPLTSAVGVESHVGAALAATVDLLADGDRFWFGVPVWSLLTTPTENLQTRAERLAAQLNADESVASAEVVALSAAESAPTGLPIRLPSAAVGLIPDDGDAARLASALRSREPAAAVRAEPDRLLIDLRTLFPRQDGELVEALLNGDSSSEAG